MELHVLHMKVLHELVLWRHRSDQFANSIPEIKRLQKQQLNDEESDLGRRK